MTDEFSRFQELLKSGRLTEALKLAEQQILEKPDPFWLTQQARILVKQRKYKPALAVAEQAINLKSSDNYAILTMADALFGLRKYAEALEYYQEVAAFPKLQILAHKKILECLVQLKKWSAVLEYCTKIEIDTEELYPFKIKALTSLDKEQEAIQECKEWLKKMPDHPRALRELVELEIRQDGLDAVLNNMERMAQIPSLPPVYKEIYASLCEKAGKHELAGKILEQIKAPASDPWIQRRKAFNLAKSNREEEAIPLLEELLHSNPEDKYLNASYAAACRRIGALEQALAYYRKLLAANPGAKSLYGRMKRIQKQLEQI